MSARRALVFSFLDRHASLAIGIASSMLIARLLTPADIGVYSVTVVLMSLAATWRDFGAGQYLVQEPELTAERIRAVWTVQIGLGTLLALLTFAASFPVAYFYREPRMRSIMWVIGMSYLLNPFGSLTYAWLSRTLRFRPLAVIRFASSLTNSAVSALLAWRGFGPMSLAWGMLAGTAVTALVSSFFRPREFPLLPGFRGVSSVLSFGSRLTATSILGTVAQGAPEMFLGKLQSMGAVGLFSRAYGLVALFNRLVTDAVGVVAMPRYAQARRDGHAIGDIFHRTNACMCVLAWSFAGFVLCCAQPLVRMLYGSQWDGSVSIVRWLSLVMFFNAPSLLVGQALIGAGASEQIVRPALITAIAAIVGSAIGSLHGAIGVVWGLAVAEIVGTSIWLRLALTVVELPARTFVSTLGRSLAVAMSATAGAAIVACLHGFGSVSTAAQALAFVVPAGVAAAVGFLVAARATRHPIWDELARLLPRRAAISA